MRFNKLTLSLKESEKIQELLDFDGQEGEKRKKGLKTAVEQKYTAVVFMDKTMQYMDVA